MEQYVGLDVSQKSTAICVIDGDGQKVWEGACRSTPAAIAKVLRAKAPGAKRIGLETGPLAVWHWHALKQAGFPVDCLHARHAKAALSTQLNKTDANDAHGLAQLVRSGWYRPVEVKSLDSHRLRLLLRARHQLVSARTMLYNQIRGLLKTFGVVLPAGKGSTFVQLVQQRLPEDPSVQLVIEVLLSTWLGIHEQVRQLDRELQRVAREHEICQRWMRVPGIGPITAVAYMTAIDDPTRFRHSKDVGPYLGLTPRRYQSGEVDRSGRISKCGDRLTRSLLFEAAGVILSRSKKPSALKDWGLELAKRSGYGKARVAVARKLAVILHRLWLDGTEFVPEMV